MAAELQLFRRDCPMPGVQHPHARISRQCREDRGKPSPRRIGDSAGQGQTRVMTKTQGLCVGHGALLGGVVAVVTSSAGVPIATAVLGVGLVVARALGVHVGHFTRVNGPRQRRDTPKN